MVFSSLEMQRRLIQTKVYYKSFYSVWKETPHKLLKVATAKKSLPSVFIIHITYFDECLLFHVITGRHCSLYKFICYPEVWYKPPCCCVPHFISVISTVTLPCCNTKGPKESFYFFYFVAPLTPCISKEIEHTLETLEHSLQGLQKVYDHCRRFNLMHVLLTALAFLLLNLVAKWLCRIIVLW